MKITRIPPRNTATPETLDRSAGAVALSSSPEVDGKTLPLSESIRQPLADDDCADEAGVAISKRLAPGESGKKTSDGHPEQLGGGGNPGNGPVVDLAKDDTSRSQDEPPGQTNPVTGTDELDEAVNGAFVKGIGLSDIWEKLNELGVRMVSIQAAMGINGEAVIRATDAAKAAHEALVPVKGFERLWEACEKKVGKGAARKAYLAAKKKKLLPPVDELIEKLKALQVTYQWSREGRQFQPHLSTWINREGWYDDIETGEPAKAVQMCPRCDGAGTVRPGGTYGVPETCKRCQGTGRY